MRSHFYPDHLRGRDHISTGSGDFLVGQLFLYRFLKLIQVQLSVFSGKILQLPEVQGDVLISISQRERSAHGADLYLLPQIDLLTLYGDLTVLRTRAQRVVDRIAGGGGKLGHRIEHHIAAGLSRGSHQIGKRPIGGGHHRIVEKAGTEQVCAGGIRGIFPCEFHQFVGNALVRLLLPLEHRAVLLQSRNFLLVALDHSLDHGFRVQSAGQSGDDVGISVSINASAGGAASQASDRCHVSFTPLTRLSPQDSTVID